MKLKRNLLSLLLLSVIASSQVLAHTGVYRCGIFGEHLNDEQARGRRAWASKCFPTFRAQIKFGDLFQNDETNELREGYPIFALVDESGNAENPENWFAPTNPNATCEHPANYTLVGFCVSGG